MITWENKNEWLKVMPHRFQVGFALLCARQLEHRWKNSPDCVHAIATVERWLEGKATQKECKVAADTANTTKASIAASYFAADTVVVTAQAAADSHTGAYFATYAARYAAQYGWPHLETALMVSVKQKQVEYLRALYIESLPEEQRNSWLVQACL